jgi:DNA ligase-1
MMRQPSSRYEGTRSRTLLKVKTFHDAEARVIGHTPGRGKHSGKCGALMAELADGTRFEIGTGLSDAERAAPPPVGAVVTFRYQELTDGGVPRFPSYVGVRTDVNFVAAAPPAKKARRFEQDGKFWEIDARATPCTIRFGVVGDDARAQEKQRALTADEIAELVAEKLAKGYVERA